MTLLRHQFAMSPKRFQLGRDLNHHPVLTIPKCTTHMILGKPNLIRLAIRPSPTSTTMTMANTFRL